MVPCVVCGTPLSPHQVLYTDRGAIICQKCSTTALVQLGHAKSAAVARNVAYGNVALGVTSLLFNPFLVLSFAAIGNAVYVFRRLRSDQQRGENFPDATKRKLAATVGAILGAASLGGRILIGH